MSNISSVKYYVVPGTNGAKPVAYVTESLEDSKNPAITKALDAFISGREHKDVDIVAVVNGKPTPTSGNGNFLLAKPTAPTPAPAPATSLLTEDLGDDQDNCLDKAATWAKPGQELVFMDSTDGGPGHVLILDKASGKAWDVNDGPPPPATQWPGLTADGWAKAHPGFRTAGILEIQQVQDFLKLKPAQRQEFLQVHSGEPQYQILVQLAGRSYSRADDSRFGPSITWREVQPRQGLSINQNSQFVLVSSDHQNEDGSFTPTYFYAPTTNNQALTSDEIDGAQQFINNHLPNFLNPDAALVNDWEGLNENQQAAVVAYYYSILHASPHVAFSNLQGTEAQDVSTHNGFPNFNLLEGNGNSIGAFFHEFTDDQLHPLDKVKFFSDGLNERLTISDTEMLNVENYINDFAAAPADSPERKMAWDSLTDNERLICTRYIEWARQGTGVGNLVRPQLNVEDYTAELVRRGQLSEGDRKSIILFTQKDFDMNLSQEELDYQLSALSPEAQAAYHQYINSRGLMPGLVPDHPIGNISVVTVPVLPPDYDFSDYASSVYSANLPSTSSGVPRNFRAAAGPEYDPSWKANRKDDPENDPDANAGLATMLVAGQGGEDGYWSDKEIYGYMQSQGVDVSLSTVQTLVQLYSPDGNPAGLDKAAVGEMISEGVLAVDPSRTPPVSLALEKVPAERVTETLVRLGDGTPDAQGKIVLDKLLTGAELKRGMERLSPGSKPTLTQADGLVFQFSQGNPSVSTTQVFNMITAGVIGPDEKGGIQIQAKSGTGAGTGTGTGTGAGASAGASARPTWFKAAVELANNAVKDPSGTFSKLLFLAGVQTTLSNKGRHGLSDSDGILDEAEVEGLINSGVIKEDARGAPVIDQSKLNVAVGQAMVDAYGQSEGAVDNNGSLDITEFQAMLTQVTGVPVPPKLAALLHAQYNKDGVEGPEQIARMLDDGAINIDNQGNLSVNADVTAGLALASKHDFLWRMYGGPGNEKFYSTGQALSTALYYQGIEGVDPTVAQKLADRYDPQSTGKLDFQAMIADGVLHYNTDTDKLELHAEKL